MSTEYERRQVLARGAVAAGIGAAGFAAPSVRSFGIAPAHGQQCSAVVEPQLLFSTGDNLTSVNCGGCMVNINLTGEQLNAVAAAGATISVVEACTESGFAGSLVVPGMITLITISFYSRNNADPNNLLQQATGLGPNFAIAPFSAQCNSFWGFTLTAIPDDTPMDCRPPEFM